MFEDRIAEQEECKELWALLEMRVSTNTIYSSITKQGCKQCLQLMKARLQRLLALLDSTKHDIESNGQYMQPLAEACERHTVNQ